MKDCPNCASYVRISNDIERCSRCGLGRSTLAPRASDSQNYVTKTEDEKRARRSYFQRLYRRYLRRYPIGISLDVGCADGLLVDILVGHGWDAHGIDSYAGLPSISGRLTQATLDAYKDSRRYDLVTMIHSLEHMPDPLAALQQCRRLLKPNGWLLVVVPNYGGVWSRMLGAEWSMLNAAEHCYHYTASALCNVLVASQFDIHALTTYSGYAPSPIQVRLARRKFYEHGISSVQPLRSLIFRGVSALRPFMNWLVDRKLDGAELQVVAIPSTDVECSCSVRYDSAVGHVTFKPRRSDT